MMEIEALCLRHPAVIAEIEKLKLPSGFTVCNDPWIYGTDDETEERRLFQCYMYIVEGEHAEANHYSLPISFSPVFDAITRELVRMDYLPTGADERVVETGPWKVSCTASCFNNLKLSTHVFQGRQRRGICP